MNQRIQYKPEAGVHIERTVERMRSIADIRKAEVCALHNGTLLWAAPGESRETVLARYELDRLRYQRAHFNEEYP